jgi:amino acid transporter/nucleotide-binding universal stress UspA family protein
MSLDPPSAGAVVPPRRKKVITPGRVVVVTSVMFTFISFWRTAAIVLCDLASTAYYIGGIVESQIGKAAPWFILAVMLFSYAVRSVYIESCAMFVRGGVYRVVKEALGGTCAKIAVSALLFDFILTGPTSSVSAGQYIVGWFVDFLKLPADSWFATVANQQLISAAIAVGITLYFWRVNIKGIHESSDKALKIMGVMTIMCVVMIVWCSATLASRPEKIQIPPTTPDLSKKIQIDPDTTLPKLDPETGQPVPVLDPFGKQVDPLGFLGESPAGDKLRPPAMQGNWLSILGVLGFLIAFGHSILAMSGEETLAQVYREVESPKLKNFKRAAFIVFVYSLIFTSLISFFAVMIVPDGPRVTKYSGNLIGGLAMNVIGPYWAQLGLNAFVVFVGFLVLSGAVNTAILGSNGVLNRVSEDGVLPDWFLKPHPRYGTSYRLINSVVILQVLTIVASRGDVLVLGEAYAFGVVWSFVFNALSMLVLRFKQPNVKRDYEVPFNIRVGKFDFPIGITIVFLVLAAAALANLLTKEVATKTGAVFTLALFLFFTVTERVHQKRLKSPAHGGHLEHFNEAFSEQITSQSLEVTRPYRKLVAIRSPHNLFMLEKCLEETDPETTDVVVMTCSFLPPGSGDYQPRMTENERALMTAVVNLAEHIGKPVKPLIQPTNEPLYAMARTAKLIGAGELIMGASNKYSADDQLDQLALYWINANEGQAAPLTIRVLARDRDVRLDVGGGGRIPLVGERTAASARTLAELRASWHGVERVLLAYDGSSLSEDFLETVLSFLDADVAVTLIDVAESDTPRPQGCEPNEEAQRIVRQGVERAAELGRTIASRTAVGQAGVEIVRAAIEDKADAIFMSLRGEYRRGDTTAFASNTRYVLEHAPCRVILGFAPKTIQAGAAPEPDGSKREPS